MESAKRQTKSAKKRLPASGNDSECELNEEDRNARIAISAYYKAQARGFEPGNELGDWLTAEA